MTSRSSDPSSADRAYQYALRLLNARDYSVSRLREKLAGNAFEEPHADAALKRLVSEGWVNDRRYAERFAEGAISSGRFVGARLRQELRRRGLPADVVSEVLGRLVDEHDEVDAARTLVERRFRDFEYASANDRDKRRVLGFLQRRGFSFSVIMRALRPE